MKRPPYIVATTLFVLWLLLNISLSPAQALLGAMVTIGLVLGLDRLRPVPPRVRAPAAIARLVGRALVDIVRSNFAVARIDGVMRIVASGSIRSEIRALVSVGGAAAERVGARARRLRSGRHRAAGSAPGSSTCRSMSVTRTRLRCWR